MILICSNCGYRRTKSNKVIGKLILSGWECKICGHKIVPEQSWLMAGNIVVPNQEVSELARD